MEDGYSNHRVDIPVVMVVVVVVVGLLFSLLWASTGHAILESPNEKKETSVQ